MHKLLLSLLALAAPLGAGAQVVLYHNDAAVEPGSTIEVLAEEKVEDFGYMTYEHVESGLFSPILVNEGDADVTLTVTVTTDDYSHFQWCGISGMCANLQATSTVRSGELLAGEEAALQLEGLYTYGTFATYNADVTVSATGQADATYHLIFVYDVRSGINSVSTSSTPAAAAAYTLDGRRADAETRGLVISNGHKTLKR